MGIVAERIAETVERDQLRVVPIGSYREEYGVILSLPSLISRKGVVRVFKPQLSADEACALEGSAAALRHALQSVLTTAGPAQPLLAGE
jgi:malate/lactate dehydrogenase